MTTRIKLRRDTAANWLSANPILAAGEPGLETDTGKIKYGDGVTAYSLLPHAGGDLLSNDAAITVQAGDATKWLAEMARTEDWQGNSYQGITANCAIYDNAGNIIVVGGIDQSVVTNLFVAKYTPAGVCVWKKSFVEISNNIQVYLENGIAIDSNDNIIISFAYNAPGFSLLKIDADGNSVWERNYASNEPSTVISGIAVDSNDHIFMTTWVANENGRIGITKINNTTGSIIWSKFLGNLGVKWAEAAGCAVDYLGNVIICGYQETVNEQASADIVVAKIDNDGNLVWKKTAIMPDSAKDLKYVNPSNVQTDALGNIYITGNYTVESPAQDSFGQFKITSAVYVAKLNTAGVVQWARRAGPGPCDWTGLSVTVGADGDLYLSAATITRAWGEGALGDNKNYEKGDYEHNLVIARYTSATGDVVWQKYFNNEHKQIFAGGNGEFGAAGNRSIDIIDDKFVICGASQAAEDTGNNRQSNSFSTAWVAQLSTESGVDFDLGGFSFVDSRVPGKKINMTTTANTDLSLSNGDFTVADGSDVNEMIEAPISTRTIRSKSHTWTFDSEGTLKAPAEGNIVLDQTELGYVNFIGYEYNDESDIWLQSVVADADGYTYAVGADSWNTRRTTIYKFDPTGKTVWAVQLHSGSGAQFDLNKDNGVYTITNLSNSGNHYKVGDTVRISGGDLNGSSPENDLVIEVLTVDNFFGNIQTYEIQSGVASAGYSDFYNQQDYNDDGESRPSSITIDPATGNLVIVGEQYVWDGGNTSVITVMVDSESGAVLNTSELHYAGRDMYPYDVQVNSAGSPAIVGQSYGEIKNIASIDPESSSSLGYMIVGKESITTAEGNTAGVYPGHLDNGSDWYVTGTGITGRAYIQGKNKYYNIPMTVTVGQGTPTFDITGSGGSYTNPVVTNGGTGGYLVGHRLKILGSTLFGVDGTNDAILEVSSVDAGVITGVTVVSGTSAGDAAYVNVTATNYQTGSGGTVTLNFDAETGQLYGYDLTTNGDNYTYGDILTVAGTAFAGGTSPANDITLSVNWTSYGGAGTRGPIQGLALGNAPAISTEWLSMEIQGYSSTDFTGAGTWTLSQGLQGEAFIWTPEFQKVFGGFNNDWFTAVAWQGTNTIFAGGTSWNYSDERDEPLIVKMAADGTVAWKKKLVHADYAGNNFNVRHIAADANGVVVIGQCYDTDINADPAIMFKLDNAGDIVWHKHIRMWDSSPNDITLAIDPATGDILTAISAYNNSVDWNIIYLNKFDQDGNILWKRKLYSAGGDGFNEDNGNRSLHIAGDSFYLAGDTYWMMDYAQNAFAARLPLDGTGIGEWGIWSYEENDDNNVRTYDKLGETTTSNSGVEVQVSTSISTENTRYFYTDWPVDPFPVINQVVRDEKGGAIVFPDGTRQTTSAAISQQVKIGREYTITPNDSGAHIFIDPSHSDGNAYVYIPYWEFVKLPVGFKFTIINASNNNCYIQIQGGPNSTGQIYGNSSRGQGSYEEWYIQGSGGYANSVDLIKVREGFNDTWLNEGDMWVIRGESGPNGDYYWSNW